MRRSKIKVIAIEIIACVSSTEKVNIWAIGRGNVIAKSFVFLEGRGEEERERVIKFYFDFAREFLLYV